MKSFDTETGGLDPFEPAEQAFLTTWSDRRGNDHIAYQHEPRSMAAFKSDMARADALAAHNMPFDVHQVRESPNGFDILKLGKPLYDTVLLAKVGDSKRRFAQGDEGGYGLDSLSKTHLPAEEQKLDLKARAKELGIKLNATGGYRKMWEADPVLFEAYAKMDTRAALELVPPLVEQCAPYARAVDIELQVMPHIIRAEARGVCTDQDKVNSLHTKHVHARDIAHAKVIDVLGPEALGNPYDPADKDEPEALREALLAHGVPLYRFTQKGEDEGTLAVNQSALAEFRTQFPVIQDLIDYRTSAKFLSTFVEPMLGKDVVHTNYNQMGAWTDRMSSARPNLQNLPVRGEGSAELRAMFVPRDGHCFLVSDYDQIELRLLAYYLNDKTFSTRIDNGDDVFAELAANLARTRGYADEFGTNPANYRKGQPGAVYRGDAKNGTYAIVYGVGAAKFSDMLGLPPGPPLGEDAWKVRKGYAKATDPSYPVGTQVIKTVKSWLPGYWDLMSTNDRDLGRVIGKVRNEGHINTIAGRRQAIDPDRAYVALSALIQGGAAAIFKQGIINAAEATAHLGALPLMFTHDELITECPIEHADEALRLQDQAMMAAWDLFPRLSVSGSICYNNYSEAK